MTGYSASIQTRDVVLACEPNATFSAGSSAWAGVELPGTAWAQSGYYRYRAPGTAVVHFRRFVEIGPPGGNYFRRFFGAPSGTINYSATLDTTTDTWTFRENGNQVATHQAPQWQGQTGTQATYAAEVYDRESQMVGNAVSRCHFGSCQYRLGGGNPVGAGFAASDMHTSDVNEWRIVRTHGTAFDVWDVNP